MPFEALISPNPRNQKEMPLQIPARHGGFNIYRQGLAPRGGLAKLCEFQGATDAHRPHFLFDRKLEIVMLYAKQLEKLERENAQAKARVKDLGARRRKLMRRADARRKVLYGVAVLALLKDLPEAKRQATLDRLHAKITKKADREFLGLSVSEATAG